MSDLVPRWKLQVFGRLIVMGAGLTVEKFDTQRSAKILARLALSRRRCVLREDLASLLWPDEPFEVTRLRLRQELNRLRRALADAAEILISDKETVSLDMELVEIDLDQVRRAAQLPEGAANRVERLRQAADLCGEPLLAHWDDDWVRAERASINEHQAKVLAEMAEQLLTQGQTAEAAAMAHRGTRLTPANEPLRRVAIEAQARLGHAADALDEYERLRRLLDEEPSDELDELVSQVQKGEMRAVIKPRSTFPPLPHSIDRFFGRAKQLHDICALLKDHRLVTLLGPGGMGKTRLALEVAHRLIGDYDGAAAFLMLADIASAEDLPAYVITQFDLQAPASTDPVTFLLRSLPPCPLLLVLDNLEHLLPDASTFLRRLLEGKPDLKVLVTSRVPLRVSGEVTQSLGPMEIEHEATEMLLSLGQAVRGGLRRDEANLTVIRQIANRLEGVPLAIRLAAPRLRFLTPQQLLEQTEARLDLQSDAPDLPSRHRSLRHALDWSFEALDSTAKEALLAMAPFRAGWTLDHLVKVTDGASSFAVIDALADSSLILVEDSGEQIRFGMLETVREYVLASASQEEQERVLRAFIACMAEQLRALTPEHGGPITLEFVQQVKGEVDNLHAASIAGLDLKMPEGADLASRLWKFDLVRGRHSEVFQRYEHWQKAGRPGDVLTQGVILFGTAWALGQLDRVPESMVASNEAQQLFLQCQRDDLAVESRALALSMGRVVLNLKESLAEFVTLSETLSRYPDAIALRGRVLAYEGGLHYYTGDLPAANECLSESLKLSEATQDASNTAFAGQLLVFTLTGQGFLHQASHVLGRIHEVVVALGDPRRLAFHTSLAGFHAFLREDFEQAQVFYEQNLQLALRLEMLYHSSSAYSLLARLHIRAGRLRKALEFAHTGYQGLHQMNVGLSMVAPVRTLAEVIFKLGDLEGARHILGCANRYAQTFPVVDVPFESDYADRLCRMLGGPVDPVDFPVTHEMILELFEQALARCNDDVTLL